MSTKQLEDWMIPPPVAPVSEGVHRPLWSVMIPTYNCAKYLRQTLESVLAQDPGPEQMQIEVIDDCSTNDDPEAVVKEVGKGRVSFYRKPKNEGAIANFNTCIDRSRGHLVHILHGDDWVLPGFYSSVTKAASNLDQTSIFFTRTYVVDELGEIEYLNQRIPELEQPSTNVGQLMYMNKIFTPSVVVRRNAYEKFGGFLPTLVHTADWEMWIRLLRASGGVYLNKPLACYRFFKGNDTNRLMRNGANIDDMLLLSQVLENRIPDFIKKFFFAQVSAIALTQAKRFMAAGDKSSYRENIKRYRSLALRQGLIPILKSFRL